MKKGESERKKQMKEGFMKLRNEGHSIGEIAKHYQLSSCTVYQSLQEIANENGVPRDSLLYVVHKPHEISKEKTSKCEVINIEELQNDFEDLLENVETIVSKIDSVVVQLEED